MGLINLIKNLTKRTNIENWELDLLVVVFAQLPSEYHVYKQQLEDGLIAGVLLSDHPMPNYVNFTFDPRISKKYENESGRFFRLKNIKVFDKGNDEWNDLEIYVTHGLVCGYCIPNERKSKPDLAEVNIIGFRKEYLDGFELEKMQAFLDQSELNLINPSDFYEVILEGKEYYHVRDLEDGDFIGIDREKNVYKITHDPFEIKLLEGDIVTNLSKY